MLRLSELLIAMSSPRLSMLSSVLLVLGLASAAHAAPLIGSAHPCTNCPVLIPDAGGIAGTPSFANAQFTVTAAACAGGPAAGGIEVEVTALHGNVGDLRLRLRDPAGTYYLLVDRPARTGGSAGSCSGDDAGLVFIESATAATPVCSEQIPGLAGETRAAVSLAGFAGAIQSGTWMVEAGDFADGGYGSLSARLQFYCTAQRSLFRDGFED